MSSRRLDHRPRFGQLAFALAMLLASFPAVGFAGPGGSGLTLSGTNTYTGATTVSAGTLELDGNNVLSASSALTINSPGVLDLNTYNATVDSLSGNGTIESAAGGNPLLTIGSAGGGGTFSGVIAGPIALAKAGTGAETLSGGNNYSGDTIVNNGTLIVDSPFLALASNAWVDNSGLGGTLDLNYIGTDSINALYINGVEQAAGIWGGPGSGKPNTSPYLAGTGELVVALPEPSAIVLLTAGAAGLLGHGWRRRLATRTPNPATIDHDAPAILSFPSQASVSAARRAA